MKRMIKANGYSELTGIVPDAEELEWADRRHLLAIDKALSDLLDALDDTGAGFLEEHDLLGLYKEVSDSLYTVAHELEPFDGIDGSTDVKASNTALVVSVPAPFDEYYRLATAEDLADYDDEDGTPCETCEGYDAKNVGWAVAKDEYADALADQGLDVVELVTFGDDPQIKLAYTVHDRIYTVDEDEILDSIKTPDEGDIEDAEQ